DRVSVEDLDEGEVLQVAVDHRRRPRARLLNRMNRELEGDPAGLADPIADARRKKEVMAVTGRDVGAGLRDPDDRPTGLKLVERQPVVHRALEVERGHVGVRRVVEPGPGAQFVDLGGGRLLRHRQRRSHNPAMASRGLLGQTQGDRGGKAWLKNYAMRPGRQNVASRYGSSRRMDRRWISPAGSRSSSTPSISPPTG